MSKVVYMKRAPYFYGLVGNLGQLIIAILVSESAGIIGALFTVTAIPTWYAALAKPTFIPPSWLFGPVWTLLYFLMGISLYLILNKRKKKNTFVKEGLIFFAMQLVFNTAWSVIFFGFHSLSLAFIEISLLWGIIIATIVRFFDTDKLAACLLIPYLGWVTYAMALTLSVWFLNG